MLTDRSESGMGMRSFRYSMYVDNKKIIKLFKDENGKFDVSDTLFFNFLKSLKSYLIDQILLKSQKSRTPY